MTSTTPPIHRDRGRRDLIERSSAVIFDAMILASRERTLLPENSFQGRARIEWGAVLQE